MGRRFTKYFLVAYLLGVSALMGVEYVGAGVRTGEWNPIRQEWKATENLAKVIAMSRNQPIYEPRKFFPAMSETIRGELQE